ncbi:MAG: OsmC family protein [Anaerolineales bacterium]|nr:OsmC family protein [Anaerolineales bacterium]
MASAKVVWLEKGQFVGIDSSNHSVVLSTRDEDNDTGMSPSELLLVAAASCSAVDIVRILEKKKMKLTRLEVQVSGEKNEEPPWAYKHITMTFLVDGEGLTDKAVAQAIQLSEEKYCSVAASLREKVKISTQYQLNATA